MTGLTAQMRRTICCPICTQLYNRKSTHSCAVGDNPSLTESNFYSDPSLHKKFPLVGVKNSSSGCFEPDKYPHRNADFNGVYMKKRGRTSKIKYQRKWRCEWDRERLELDRRMKELYKKRSNGTRTTNRSDVLKALSQALKKTEETYLDLADKMVIDNPELALMGSCVLVMLMKRDDVYVLNVGDSRAVLAQKKEPDLWRQDLERINDETLCDLEDLDFNNDQSCLAACQLTMDHSTSIEQEVKRIKNEHLDDASAVINDRAKGSLKVIRAFGAGFLKQPKWNDALLEMF